MAKPAQGPPPWMEPGNDDASQFPDTDGQQLEQGNSTSSIAPIHWQHRRYESYASLGHTKPAPIRLEDNTEETLNISWAKAVTIDDHVTVSGGIRGIGDYTIWNCKIDTLDVSLLSLCYFMSFVPARS